MKDPKSQSVLSRGLDILLPSSAYEKDDGTTVLLPSLFFDSVGTRRYIEIMMHLVNTVMDGLITFIDGFDISINSRLAKALLLLMTSLERENGQFILTTHCTELLDSKILRKDQVTMIYREKNNVSISRISDFKANSDRDIRSYSQFVKAYESGALIPLPTIDISNILAAFEKENKTDEPN